MNVLKEFLKAHESLKGKMEIDTDIDLKNKKGLALQVPPIFYDVDMVDQEFILRVPHDKICDHEIKILIDILDFLNNGSTRVIAKNDKEYDIIFYWDRQIVFNQNNEKGSYINSIRFKCKILERKAE
jgi:hypothetical protein